MNKRRRKKALKKKDMELENASDAMAGRPPRNKVPRLTPRERTAAHREGAEST